MLKIIRAFKITSIFIISILIWVILLFIVKYIIFIIFAESEGSELAYSWGIISLVYLLIFANKANWIEEKFKLKDKNG